MRRYHYNVSVISLFALLSLIPYRWTGSRSLAPACRKSQSIAVHSGFWDTADVSDHRRVDNHLALSPIVK